MNRILLYAGCAAVVYAAYLWGVWVATPPVDPEEAIRLAYYLGQEDTILEVIE
jgi:hypothetical protein